MRGARLALVGMMATVGLLFGGNALEPALSWADAPTTAPSTQPDRLAAFGDLIKKCGDYDRISSNWKWGTIYTADFRPGQEPTWQPDPGATPSPQSVQTGYMHEEGRDELLVNGLACSFCLLDVGPKVRGECAIDMVCKSIGPRLNDLSILLGGLHSGPGFQFGSYDNTKAVIWAGAGPGDNLDAIPPTTCQGSPQTIVANQWYHVRMEVKNGTVRGLVDGHEVGKIALSPGFPLDQPHSAILYCYNSQMVLREAHVEAWTRDTKQVDPAAWSKVFGNDDPATVQKQLDNLVRLLADSDAITREQAEHTLSSMGELAIPAVQRAVGSDVPELSVRAARTLTTLQSAGKAPNHG